MFSYTHQIRVRYGDTDQMGYVYYGNYAYYYEQARAEAIRSVGITYKQLEDSGIMMPITRMTVKYIQPARYDELINVRTFVPEMPNRIITFAYEITNEAGALLNEGETQLIFVDAVTRKMKPIPAVLMDKLKPFYNLSNG